MTTCDEERIFREHGERFFGDPPDAEDEEPAAHCAECGRAVYYGEECNVLGGDVYCTDCCKCVDAYEGIEAREYALYENRHSRKAG